MKHNRDVLHIWRRMTRMVTGPSYSCESLLIWPLVGCRANVMFAFALPVLSIVAVKMGLFVASLCRLSATWKNAAFVGLT